MISDNEVFAGLTNFLPGQIQWEKYASLVGLSDDKPDVIKSAIKDAYRQLQLRDDFNLGKCKKDGQLLVPLTVNGRQIVAELSENDGEGNYLKIHISALRK